MLNHYVDIEIIEDSEFSNEILLNATFAKLHKQLFLREKKIGVSFPMHTEKNLGKLLRLHSNETELLRLMAEKWYGNLFSYLRISQVLQVPANTKYRKVARICAEKCFENRLRRAEKYNRKIVFDPSKEKKMIDKPYLLIKSISNKNTFKLFVDHKEIEEHFSYPSDFVFSSYGLSKNVAVPWFWYPFLIELYKTLLSLEYFSVLKKRVFFNKS